MANQYLVDIGMNDHLQDVIRKSNHNFRRLGNNLNQQTQNDIRIGNQTIRQEMAAMGLSEEEIDAILDCDCSGYWDDDAMDIYLAQVAELIADAGMLPAGGLADQVLTKVNGDDFNTYWADPPEGDDDEPISNLEIDAILTLSDLGD